MISCFLRTHPYLKPVNINNLFERLLQVSNNTMLCLYNKKRDTYELHSIKSFKLNGESLNVVLEEDMLNGWLVLDYLANNLNKFGKEVEADRVLTNETLELYESKGLEHLTNRALKTVEKIVGREI